MPTPTHSQVHIHTNSHTSGHVHGDTNTHWRTDTPSYVFLLLTHGTMKSISNKWCGHFLTLWVPELSHPTKVTHVPRHRLHIHTIHTLNSHSNKNTCKILHFTKASLIDGYRSLGSLSIPSFSFNFFIPNAFFQDLGGRMLQNFMQKLSVQFGDVKLWVCISSVIERSILSP